MNSSHWTITSFAIRIISGITLSIILIFFVINFLGMPITVNRMLFAKNSWYPAAIQDLGWIERIIQRIQTYELVRVVLKQNHSSADSNQDEVELLIQTLLPFKKLLLSQVQVNHLGTQNSALVWGLGFCDSVNAVGAIALAQYFDRVEMVGVQGNKIHGGHSLGRVWLPKMQEWVFFDLWPDDLFILVINKTSKVEILRRIDSFGIEKSHSLSGDSEWLKVYRDLAQAKSYLIFPKTALNYLIRTSIRDHLPTSLSIYLTPYATFKTTEISVPTPKKTGHTEETNLPQKALRIYLDARREHVFGNKTRALKLYKEFLNQAPNNTPLAKAAKIFQIELAANNQAIH